MNRRTLRFLGLAGILTICGIATYSYSQVRTNQWPSNTNLKTDDSLQQLKTTDSLMQQALQAMPPADEWRQQVEQCEHLITRSRNAKHPSSWRVRKLRDCYHSYFLHSADGVLRKQPLDALTSIGARRLCSAFRVESALFSYHGDMSEGIQLMFDGVELAHLSSGNLEGIDMIENLRKATPKDKVPLSSILGSLDYCCYKKAPHDHEQDPYVAVFDTAVAIVLPDSTRLDVDLSDKVNQKQARPNPQHPIQVTLNGKQLSLTYTDFADQLHTVHTDDIEPFVFDIAQNPAKNRTERAL